MRDTEKDSMASSLRAGQEEDFALVDGMSMTFCWIPPGEFMMGSPVGEGFDDERPCHWVEFTEGFWLGKYLVTASQWKSVMGTCPVDNRRGDVPIECVSWEECRRFLERCSSAGDGVFRFPSELEWEYACRAGTTTPFGFGADENLLAKYGWFEENSGREVHSVGEKLPNEWGLFDMHGNVGEWCGDRYGSDYSTDICDYEYPVVRGGDIFSPSGNCRSACRDFNCKEDGCGGVGFRVLRHPCYGVA